VSNVTEHRCIVRATVVIELGVRDSFNIQNDINANSYIGLDPYHERNVKFLSIYRFITYERC
jgi:hypothetical protein